MSAAIPEWFYPLQVWKPQCTVRRQWSCTEPQPTENQLLCTCAPATSSNVQVTSPTMAPVRVPTVSPSAKAKVAVKSPSMLPTVAPTTIPSSANPSTKPTKFPVFKSTTKPTKGVARHLSETENVEVNGRVHVDAVAISSTRSPTTKLTRSPSAFPTQSPVVINPANKYLATSCLLQLTGDEYQPYRFCEQDLSKDTCTALVQLHPHTNTGSCSQYCTVHGLQCVAAYKSWYCTAVETVSCTAQLEDWGAVSCIEYEVFFLLLLYTIFQPGL